MIFLGITDQIPKDFATSEGGTGRGMGDEIGLRELPDLGGMVLDYSNRVFHFLYLVDSIISVKRLCVWRLPVKKCTSPNFPKIASKKYHIFAFARISIGLLWLVNGFHGFCPLPLKSTTFPVVHIFAIKKTYILLVIIKKAYIP
jgi:hypothetical protein